MFIILFIIKDVCNTAKCHDIQFDIYIIMIIYIIIIIYDYILCDKYVMIKKKYLTIFKKIRFTF